MTLRALAHLALLPLLTIGGLHAQRSDAPPLIRTLRIIVAGKRPLPVFEQRGNKVVEVDPPLSAFPPRSFSFTPSHAPRVKGSPGKVSHSAWPNQLVHLKNYKGPAILPLKLTRPLLGGESQQVNCNLGEAINPLVVLHADSKSPGWLSPKAMVIDMNPEKIPARSVTLINLSGVALKIYLNRDGQVIPPSRHRTLRIPTASKEAVRYRIDASDGKELIKVANSSYRVSENSRLLIIALPGHKTKGSPFPRPKISMITDKVEVAPKPLETLDAP